MIERLPDWLVVEVIRCLSGEIYPSIRAIAISLSKEKILTIRYYLDRDPIDMDIESIDIVAFNIAAGIGLNFNLIAKIETECVFSDKRLNQLDRLDGFIYSRREYDI